MSPRYVVPSMRLVLLCLVAACCAAQAWGDMVVLQTPEPRARFIRGSNMSIEWRVIEERLEATIKSLDIVLMAGDSASGYELLTIASKIDPFNGDRNKTMFSHEWKIPEGLASSPDYFLKFAVNKEAVTTYVYSARFFIADKQPAGSEASSVEPVQNPQMVMAPTMTIPVVISFVQQTDGLVIKAEMPKNTTSNTTTTRPSAQRPSESSAGHTSAFYMLPLILVALAFY